MQIFGIGGTIAEQIKIGEQSVFESNIGIESNGRQSAECKTGFDMLGGIGGKGTEN
jgi:hypothetical protein